MSWAAVFDLDDTLYAYDGFVASGYRAVGAYLANISGVDPAEVFDTLRRARAGDRGREFQVLCDAYGWPPAQVPNLVNVFRHHEPAIRLDSRAVPMLEGLRRRGWRLGVLTNGYPAVQRAKVRALGLAPLVDGVIYAEEEAPGGKPAPQVFQAIVARLGADASRTVMVGDDLERDIRGARCAGLHAVYVASPSDLEAVPDLLASIASRSENVASRSGDVAPRRGNSARSETVHVG